MKIYDCFTFYNELDLLELRLTELYDSVDYFVLVEANTTFTNRVKPYLFEENSARFAQFADKIRHIQIQLPQSSNPWDNEKFQRDSILNGLADAEDDDIIIISDVDEIPRKSAVEYIKKSSQALFAFRMTISNFRFNYVKLNPDRYNIWAMAGRRSVFDEITPDSFRNLRFQFMSAPYQYSNEGCEVVEHGGWHFGYMGDRDYLIDKAQSFSHTEVNRPEFIAQIDPEASMQKGTSWQQDSADQYIVVALDNYFPNSLIANKDKYQQYILNDTDTKILDILPKYSYNT